MTSPQTDPPCYLGLDSATRYLSLALWSPQKGTLADFCEPLERDHARRIMLELTALCDRAGVSRQALVGIGVGTGPGSYTGLRVAIAAARGLARGLALPLTGIDTLEAMAANYLSERRPEAVVTLDARRGNVYAAAFKRQSNTIIMQGEVRKLPRAALTHHFGALPCAEGVAPNGHYLAQRAAQGGEQDPVGRYL